MTEDEKNIILSEQVLSIETIAIEDFSSQIIPAPSHPPEEIIQPIPSLFFGSDHAGFKLKQFLINKYKDLGATPFDCGTHTAERCDYPDFAKQVVDKVLSTPYGKGVLICGTGIGMSIAANRHRHIRAACCYKPEIAKVSRKHNDINILCLGERVMDFDVAWECLQKFLTTNFENGRHKERIARLDTF